jgi:MFS transporter, SHS family, lactate transporter
MGLMIILQDLYPTMLENQYNFDANQVTVTQVVANLGAMFGGTAVGYCSQIFGRRFSICVMCIVGGALLYPYTFTGGSVVAGELIFVLLLLSILTLDAW